MKIAIIIPCYNEAVTIAKVIRDFRASIPEADIHVFDNLSADGTGDIARAAGAIVHLVPVQGKGAVVRQMFRDIECDIGVMVDGDDTYPADKVRLLIQPVIEGRAEMVVGTRLQKHEDASFRPLHVFGNQLVLRSINTLFGATLSDVLSGYRAFSTRFMSTTPVLSKGFEIETEITLHALEHHMPIVEVPVPYGVRPDGSESKLHTFRDGYRVLKAILWLYKDYRPLFFFGMLSTGLLFVALLMGGVIVEEFLDKGSVAPARAMFAAALGLVGVVAFSTGMVLDTVNRRARELNILIADQLISRSRR
ncbi:MAG: glycosyltransferase [Rhodocyclaceae bacterium]|nr:glycosyltransferase [Rhodocyclaceae bacterium]MCA3024007.1 glycosyltransferase [Rhodocyclaceae bacterium]MCA3031879.1 glycosyltransferase [Rhodocyclaceae bacterium]MCA3036585.1 glycosyltransferase [Rhodocyclaceae bacterium]MCA3040649.1 glycosyltransferase [Rhodocyclaceae bacterium]